MEQIVVNFFLFMPKKLTYNKNNLTFNLLNNILGGPNINSRLNLLVREKEAAKQNGFN